MVITMALQTDNENKTVNNWAEETENHIMEQMGIPKQNLPRSTPLPGCKHQ